MYAYERNWKIILSSTEKQNSLKNVIEHKLNKPWFYKIIDWEIVLLNDFNSIKTEWVFYVWSTLSYNKIMEKNSYLQDIKKQKTKDKVISRIIKMQERIAKFWDNPTIEEQEKIEIIKMSINNAKELYLYDE